jgi:transaldolase
MRFFAVTHDLHEIASLAASGLLDGVAVSPSVNAKPGQGAYTALVASIAATISGPICANVAALDHKAMLAEGVELAKIAGNVVVTVPATAAGLKACKALRDAGTMCAVTLCFTAAQTLFAAKAGANFVLPYVGGLEDSGDSGIRLVGEVCDLFRNYPNFKTEVFAASLRTANQVMECARIGAHGALVPPKILHQLPHHALTEKGAAQFAAEAQKASATA